jgi:hypothetical protein
MNFIWEFMKASNTLAQDPRPNDDLNINLFPRHILSSCAVSIHANQLVAPAIGVPANSLQLSLARSGRYVNLYILWRGA